jgi:bacillithiol system protein YtxJ
LTWIELSNKTELEHFHNSVGSSEDQFSLIFKHSTRCGTSMIAKKEFEKHWKTDLPIHLVNVVESREVSNAIESMYQVRHESPQLLIIKNGKCVYHESHHGIDANEAGEFIRRT